MWIKLTDVFLSWVNQETTERGCGPWSSSRDEDDDVDDDETELLSLSDADTERRRCRRTLSSCRRRLPCSLINSSRVLVSLTWHTCSFCARHKWQSTNRQINERQSMPTANSHANSRKTIQFDSIHGDKLIFPTWFDSLIKRKFVHQ